MTFRPSIVDFYTPASGLRRVAGFVPSNTPADSRGMSQSHGVAVVLLRCRNAYGNAFCDCWFAVSVQTGALLTDGCRTKGEALTAGREVVGRVESVRCAAGRT